MATSEFWKKRALRVPDGRRENPHITLRESIWPICLVTTHFFLWGFSYGLLDTLNKHFQVTLNITKARSSGIQAAYFGAYPLASLGHAAWILRHFGYRTVLIYGLVLYGVGALLAIAAIKTKSFGGFCACIFIIGNGLGSLETAANPYITVCGPPRLAEFRINISQAFNGIGTVVAPVLGSYVLFTFDDETALKNVQWIYLSIAVFVFLLATVFFFSPIPEITDADMQLQAEQSTVGSSDVPLRKQYRLFHAAFAQFCYVASQVAVASFFINYATEVRANTPNWMGSQLLAGGQAAFTVGRFVGVRLIYLVRPRWVFLGFLTLVIVFTALSIGLTGNAGIAMLYCILLFESICFPTIVALGMRGLGRHTKAGSGFLVGAVLGGAVGPPLMGYVADLYGTGTSMFVPLIFFVAAWTYPLAVNFVPSYRKVADSFGETNREVEAQAAGKIDPEAEMIEFAVEKRTSKATA